ncbi:MAG: hypothetical protein PHP98_03350 [Kiritimatiellae bacterium]|nr:hypothetical protein [Kiritimatiellia bacterium]
MIPDIQACLLCDDVRQERNGKFILIGLFDVINANQYPLVFPRMCLVSRWCNGEGEFQQMSRLLKPDQKKVVAQGRSIPVKLQNTEAIVTNIEFFINIAFTESGVHWIEVLLDNDLKIRFPLRVTPLPSPAAGNQKII